LRTLVIDTATAACSVALIDSGRVIAEQHEVVGRGHAERLIPTIAALPDGGRAAAISVDCGPGSFTGIRVGLAAALGLGLGWGVPVRGYSATAMVAAACFAQHDGLDSVWVVLEGGHGEVFMQEFAATPFSERTPLASRRPAEALAALGRSAVVGAGIRWLDGLDPQRALGEALPRAADLRLLPAAFADLPPRPIYGRAPDAKTLAERGA
jgi:tRNA threonylcarbamoyl adenosine modification protein YeaZ